MQWARPEWLWLLAALSMMAAVSALAERRRRRDWALLGQGGRPGRDGSVYWLLASAALGIALAQPRWGRSAGPPPKPGHDVVVAVDVSRSMAARDAVPDRLGAAVEAAEGLIRALGADEGDRVAVVAFAGRGVLRCPLTADLGAAVDTLHALKPGSFAKGGTDLAAGLDAAEEAFDDQPHAGGRSVVLFSDGEDHAGGWRTAAERLRARGVIVHTVAVGDPDAGHTIPARSGGETGPLRYQGSVVLSRRSDESLSAIAQGTGGSFVPLGLASADMRRLYRTRIEPGERAFRRLTVVPERAERFPWFLLAALGLIVAASVPGGVRRTVSSGVVVSTLAIVIMGASPRGGVGDLVANGRAFYEAGRIDEALSLFRRALRLAPANPVAAYDVAATLFQLGRYEEAQTLYEQARRRADAPLRVKIDYALGNTAAARGDLAAAVRHYDACLTSTAPGADLDRVRADAAVNLRFVQEQSRQAAPPSGPGDAPPSKQGPDAGNPKTPREGTGAGAARGAPGPDDGSPAGKRGVGGLGGGGPSSARQGTPEDQLARALEDVREARRGRIDEETAADVREEGKDW